MLETRHIQAQFEVREEDGTRRIAGLAIPFNTRSVDLGGFREIISPNAFALEERDIKALWSHDRSRVLGSTKSGTMKLRKQDDGIHFDLLPPDNTWGHDAVETIARGDVDGVSFGMLVRRDDLSKDPDGTIVRTVLDADLVEVSPVAFPAYGSATNVSVRDEMRARIDALNATDELPESVPFDPETNPELRLLKARLLMLED